jgi:murein DD-endopeptidase MepM/ murein hydrolase activator NlpD
MRAGIGHFGARRAAAIALSGLTTAALFGPVARADRASDLQSQVAAKRAAEQQLNAGIAADSTQINRYRASIGALQAHLTQVENGLAQTRAQLQAVRSQEQIERARLIAVEHQLAVTNQALARSLLSQYESAPPDWVTVVFNAHGFADLLEKLDFLRRAHRESANIIVAARRARAEVIAEAQRLGALQAREQRVEAVALVQRNELASARVSLVSRQLAVVRSRARQASALAATTAQRRRLESSLARLEQAQAAAQSTSSSTAGGASFPVGVHSAGGFTFPLPSGAVGRGSWSQDQGVDIAAPGNSPLVAVGGGTIVIHGIGGFGPWAPVLHLDSPISGQSYVYYGHAGPQGELPVGTHVSAGQVIGSVGPGIVGMSTGPHLEIGFADASGTPASGTSGLMMSLLQSSGG